MKLLLASAFLFLTTVSFAQNIALTSNDMSISLITSGKIAGTQNVAPKCPAGARCFPQRLLKLALTLNGCLDKLGPVTSTVQYNERTTKYDVFVTATQIHNKGSLTARCVAANVKSVTVVVPMGLDKDNTNLVLEHVMINATEVETAPVRCTREFMPVCGIKPRVCPPGMMCPAVMPAPQTYGNKCLMKADGATLVHEGACGTRE